MSTTVNSNATGGGGGLSLTSAQITAGATGVIASDSSGNAYKQDGTAFSGGGSTTYAGLTDAATVDLPTVNGPLGTALGLKANANAVEPITTIGTTGNQTLASNQNNQVIPTSTNSVITVNTGLGAGFGCAFVGAGVVTFAGTATVTDHRTTGAANPACSLIPVGTDTYFVVGSKA